MGQRKLFFLEAMQVLLGAYCLCPPCQEESPKAKASLDGQVVRMAVCVVGCLTKHLIAIAHLYPVRWLPRYKRIAGIAGTVHIRILLPQMSCCILRFPFCKCFFCVWSFSFCSSNCSFCVVLPLEELVGWVY